MGEVQGRLQAGDWESLRGAAGSACSGVEAGGDWGASRWIGESRRALAAVIEQTGRCKGEGSNLLDT